MIKNTDNETNQEHKKDEHFNMANIPEDIKITTKNFVYRREVLCLTLSGLSVPIITVTSKRGKGSIPMHKRQAVFITARVHPGESNSSFVFEGIYNFILSK
jgi:hypothetical protein